jgi:hypothetical protein
MSMSIGQILELHSKGSIHAHSLQQASRPLACHIRTACRIQWLTTQRAAREIGRSGQLSAIAVVETVVSTFAAGHSRSGRMRSAGYVPVAAVGRCASVGYWLLQAGSEQCV